MEFCRRRSCKKAIGNIDKFSINDSSLTLIKYLDKDKLFTISIQYLDFHDDQRPTITDLVSIEGYKQVELGWIPITLRYCLEGHLFVSILNEVLDNMKKFIKEE